MGALKKIQRYQSVLGWRGAAMFVLAKLTGTKPLFKVSLPGIKYPVLVRIGTTDLSVLQQVLVERHYDLPCVLNPHVIVDAGANIGLSAVYFANQYPGATIVAIEPEESNYEVLRRNVAPYSRIKTLKTALWKENKPLRLFDPGKGSHGFRTGESGAQEAHGMVDGKTVDALMREMGLAQIDILKMDIEGAESQVLQDPARWIDKVGIIMIELHGDDCRDAFHRVTRDFAEEFVNGETVTRSRSTRIRNDAGPSGPRTVMPLTSVG